MSQKIKNQKKTHFLLIFDSSSQLMLLIHALKQLYRYKITKTDRPTYSPMCVRVYEQQVTLMTNAEIRKQKQSVSYRNTTEKIMPFFALYHF